MYRYITLHGGCHICQQFPDMATWTTIIQLGEAKDNHGADWVRVLYLHFNCYLSDPKSG